MPMLAGTGAFFYFAVASQSQDAQRELLNFSPFRSSDGRVTGWKITIPGNRPLASPAIAEGKVFVGGGFGSREFLAVAEVGVDGRPVEPECPTQHSKRKFWYGHTATTGTVSQLDKNRLCARQHVRYSFEIAGRISRSEVDDAKPLASWLCCARFRFGGLLPDPELHSGSRTPDRR